MGAARSCSGVRVEEGGERRGHLGCVRDDLDRRGPALEFEIIGALARRVPGPADPVGVLVDHRLGRHLGTDGAGGEARHDAHGRGVAAGQRQDAPAAAADDERGAPGRHGRRRCDRVLHAVVLAAEGGTPGPPHGAHDLEALGQPRHPHRRRLHRDPRMCIVGRQPAGTHAELEAAAAHHVEGGRLLGEDQRVPEVVVEDERPDAQCRRGFGRDGEGDHGRPLVVEVIGDVEGRVAEIFGLSRQIAPRSGGGCPRRLEGEPEGGHEGRSYGVNLVR